MSAFLDGYTFDGVVPAKGRVPKISYRYRPALPEAHHEFQHAYGKAASGRERLKAITDLLLAHLDSWDLIDPRKPDGTVPITLEALRRLRPQVLDALLNDVMGYTAEQQADDVKN